MIRIDSAFDPITSNVHTFFQQPGIGYYIPLYQREYTWDSDNIEQLLQDISKGIENAIDEDDEIRFLGTIIAVQETNPTENIEPQDPQGLPSRIDKIIDGQQRLSTLALFATKIHEHLIELENKLPNHEFSETLKEASRNWKDKLVDLFSLDLKRGKPERKPKLIRGDIDQWTRDGEVKKNYKSDIAKYLAEYIEYHFADGEKPKLDRKTKVGENLKMINDWIQQTVINAHVNNNTDFVPAWEIIGGLKEEYIWLYNRPNLKEAVNRKEINNRKSFDFIVCSMAQLFSVCHYLLERCCFTIIKPSKDDWAFDLFQSLNATGTPLTAIETFLPLVVNSTKKIEGSYKNSNTKVNFENIQNLFSHTKTAAQKNKLTNDFLTSLAITTDGEILSSHFSQQRKWLNEVYKENNEEQKEELIKFLGNYAKFYKEIWLNYKGANELKIDVISQNSEADLVSLLILFLKSSNHKMSITLLGRFYNDLLNGEDGSIISFIMAVKAISSFYIIWRSAKSNSGLDNVYREFLKNSSKEKRDGKNWMNNKSICIDDLTKYLQNVLSENNIETKESWMAIAKNNFKYNHSASVCKIGLFLAFEGTITDSESIGLMKKGVEGTSPYFNLFKWNSAELKSIEHIAPQKGKDSGWDKELYNEDETFQLIGNLTLLPTKINSSAGNKGWKEKIIYYKHLSEKDPDKLQELASKAKSEGINLNTDTVTVLQNSSFNEHILPLVENSENKTWNKNVVIKRTDRILELIWDRINSWLDL
ncbi:DUF262 domain-containing protein [Aquimarina celericrescens]|uniref:DUF262 domain-containing protein n=1 Tax=Aquimarina celericrescens TaxID=1964542 RepID=A0ABW5AWC6_9FLAO|nr:DUF262 domain-containing protein [Aquimarina celericrescens]